MNSCMRRSAKDIVESPSRMLIVNCENHLMDINSSLVIGIWAWGVEPDSRRGFKKIMKLVE